MFPNNVLLKESYDCHYICQEVINVLMLQMLVKVLWSNWAAEIQHHIFAVVLPIPSLTPSVDNYWCECHYYASTVFSKYLVFYYTHNYYVYYTILKDFWLNLNGEGFLNEQPHLLFHILTPVQNYIFTSLHAPSQS